MQFLGVTKWCSANAFSDTKQKHFCWKICWKVRKIFGCVPKAYYFQCQVSWGSMVFLTQPPHYKILPAVLLQTNLYEKSTDCQNYLHFKSTHLLSLLKKVSLIVKHRGIQKTFPRPNKKIFWTWLQWIDCKKTN